METQNQSRTTAPRKALAFLVAALIAALAAGAAIAKQNPTAAQPEKAKRTYAGSEACQTCHEDQAKWFQSSVHEQARKMELKAPQKGNGCESCHGPGSAHVDNPSKDNILTFKTESAQQRSDACLACHSRKAGMMDYERTEHRTHKIACDQCHTNGDSKAFHSIRQGTEIRRASSKELCLGCHTEKRGSFSMPFHHKVNEGLVACQDCHREHNGYSTGRRRTAQFNEACVRCHAEQEGPFVFEHIPMRVGGCTSCHAPHGSSNPRLLVRSQVLTLCLECHGTATKNHDLSQVKYQNCTICHKAIHGSNHNQRLFE